MSKKVQSEIRKTYPENNRYLAFPETNDGRGDLDKFARRRAGADSWQMGGGLPCC